MYRARFPFMHFDRLDIEGPLDQQKFLPESFDLVLGANVVHTTRLLHRSLQTCKALLKPNGVLILLEAIEARVFNGLTYGLLDGWWLFRDGERRIDNAPLLTSTQWCQVFYDEGFREVSLLGRSTPAAARLFQAVVVGESDGVVAFDVVNSPKEIATNHLELRLNDSVQVHTEESQAARSEAPDPEEIFRIQKRFC